MDSLGFHTGRFRRHSATVEFSRDRYFTNPALCNNIQHLHLCFSSLIPPPLSAQTDKYLTEGFKLPLGLQRVPLFSPVDTRLSYPLTGEKLHLHYHSQSSAFTRCIVHQRGKPCHCCHTINSVTAL